MPRKVFTGGSILQAAEVNTFLMDQAVMVFDDATARDTAIPSPIQGMVTFLKDLNVLEAWFGDRWGQVSGAGSITVSETAPTGPEVEDGALWFNSVLGRTFIYYEDDDSAQWVEIGAGSGPTAAAVLTSAPTSAEQGQLWFDAETGNMYFYYVDADSAQWIQVRSAAPVGGTLEDLGDVDVTGAADGDTIVYDSATGEWGNFPSGKILQVVSTTKSDTFSASITSGNSTDVTGFSVSITPTSATSKILVFVVAHSSSGNNTGNIAGIIVRDSTQLALGDAASTRSRVSVAEISGGTDDSSIFNISQMFLDSPNTTSETVYKYQLFNRSSSTQTLHLNRGAGDDDGVTNVRTSSSITVMEVAA